MSVQQFDQLIEDYEKAPVNTREFKKELATVAAIVVAVVVLNALGKF